ncbi:hypothetical protein OESDEN_11726 [Oesophagostomum dentatum]|uniref:Uncharacterized protein n=1 Tax=Oesophagostomum dentatum TaxID=61180 RepID=A0A0B1ST34_OESDE|nr:hypothetical protein OESDEN_11726 [Oesophagostomum dentatum]
MLNHETEHYQLGISCSFCLNHSTSGKHIGFSAESILPTDLYSVRTGIRLPT